MFTTLFITINLHNVICPSRVSTDSTTPKASGGRSTRIFRTGPVSFAVTGPTPARGATSCPDASSCTCASQGEELGPRAAAYLLTPNSKTGVDWLSSRSTYFVRHGRRPYDPRPCRTASCESLAKTPTYLPYRNVLSGDWKWAGNIRKLCMRPQKQPPSSSLPHARPQSRPPQCGLWARA